VNSFLHQLLDILEVTHHPLFEVLQSAPNVNLLILQFTSDLVDDDQNPAHVSILALSISPGGVYTVAFPHRRVPH
jgi:hypothetical protein